MGACQRDTEPAERAPEWPTLEQFNNKINKKKMNALASVLIQINTWINKWVRRHKPVCRKITNNVCKCSVLEERIEYPFLIVGCTRLPNRVQCRKGWEWRALEWGTTLRQVIRSVIKHVDKALILLRWCEESHILPLFSSSSKLITLVQSWEKQTCSNWGRSAKIYPVLLETVKVIKNKERLKNCYIQEEP